MDNQQHDILERYLDAARQEPGISEEQAWAIFERRMADPRPVAGHWMRKRNGALLLLAILLLGVSVLLLTPGLQPDRNADRGSLSAGHPVARRLEAAHPATASVPAGESARATRSGTSEAPSPAVSGSPGTRNAGQRSDRTAARTRRSEQRDRSSGRPPDTLPLASNPAQPPDSAGASDGNQNTLPTAEQIRAWLGTASSEYWKTHLDEYKKHLDSMLQPAERLALDRLRARFALAMVRFEAESVEHGGSVDTAIYRDEVRDIYKKAAVLAEPYSSAFDQHRAIITQNFTHYFKVLRGIVTQILSMPGSELPCHILADSLRVMLDDADTVTSQLTAPAGEQQMSRLYSVALRPTVMLYDGEDPRETIDWFDQAMGLFGMSEVTHDVPGFAYLPERRPLGPVQPEPSGKQVEVPYRLDEPAEATLLRIVDAKGVVRATVDPGKQPAGEHTAVVDISTLPDGDYLCQATITTSEGEQTHSALMRLRR